MRAGQQLKSKSNITKRKLAMRVRREFAKNEKIVTSQR